MSLAVLLGTFGAVFVAELPDKTMVASLVLATQGRPLAVWAGAMVGFAVQVALGVAVGALFVHLLPPRALDAGAAALFLAGAVWAFAGRHEAHDDDRRGQIPAGRTVLVSAAVIFVAEWGDLTQLVIIDLSARSGAPVSVGLGAIAALGSVAALAVTLGARFLGRLSTATLRTAMAVVLVALAAWSAVGAVAA